MSYLQNFRNNIRGKKFYILDTETTALKRGEICQIAITDSNGLVELNSLVKTVNAIPDVVTEIHGIDDAMVKDAPEWPELAPKIKQILDGQILVVYNAIYDRSFMHQTQELHNLPKIEWSEICQWNCAMEAYAEFYGQINPRFGTYTWQKLVFAAQNCGVAVENAHSALGDCLMTLGVVNYMLKAESEVGNEGN
jgi:DNA polymerase III subunit epsilon